MSSPDTSRFAEQQTWSLDQWLSYLESIHSKNIDMGLSRVEQVFNNLKLDFSSTKVVTVAGTNGKGTTCAMLEQGALLKGLNVGVYSSPHIVRYTERVRINGKELSERDHCQAFLAIEQARGDIPLTYFEFGTLAGVYLLAKANCHLTLLEVGLGGRLDAVNIVDPDIAVVTSIDLDHQDWLGDTREKIGFEKAGIFREKIPVVVGDPNPPHTVIEQAEKLNTESHWQGKEFRYQLSGDHWKWQSQKGLYHSIELPKIPVQNASTALCVLELLGITFEAEELALLMEKAALPGRNQLIQRSPDVVLDVAHNPQATEHLVKSIDDRTYQKLHLVVAMLADKDIKNSLAPLLPLDADWYVAPLDVFRGAGTEQIKPLLVGQQKVVDFASVDEAYQQALKNADKNDLVVVFGSFYTVAEILNK